MKPLTFAICIAVSVLFFRVEAAAAEARLPEKHREFFKAHCLDCHDSETREGKVDLEELPFHISTLEQAETWQKVLNVLNSGEMPPEDSPQPGNLDKANFLDDLAQTMVTARQVLSDSGGKITMRRLNRREYRNTIEQLTGVKIDVVHYLPMADREPSTRLDPRNSFPVISSSSISSLGDRPLMKRSSGRRFLRNRLRSSELNQRIRSRRRT